MYEISTDPAKLDIPAIHRFLTAVYWSEGISLETVERAVQGSLCFGLFHGDDQVGFARVVTDRTTFAYLCDVYVLEAHRGKGLGKRLTEAVLGHSDLQGLRRFNLVTRDAHGLYEKLGFQPLKEPSRYMEIWNPAVYRKRGV